MQKYWNISQKVPNIEIMGKLAKYWNILKCNFVQNHNIEKLIAYSGFSRHNIFRKKKYISIQIRSLLIIKKIGIAIKLNEKSWVAPSPGHNHSLIFGNF